MVDAGSDFAVPFNSWESNVAVGASSTPIHVAALVVQIGHSQRLFRESLYQGFPSPYTNSARKTTLLARSLRLVPAYPVEIERLAAFDQVQRRWRRPPFAHQDADQGLVE